MQTSWLTSQSGQLLTNWIGSSKPTWIWSHDGEELVWCNDAARLFRAKTKKGRLKSTKSLAPIRGQIKRLLRLGSLYSTSLSRVPFVVKDKPVSLTCRCTPLLLPDESVALLVVGTEPTDDEALAHINELVPATYKLFPKKLAYVLRDADGRILGGSPAGLTAARGEKTAVESREYPIDGGVVSVEFSASAHDSAAPRADALPAEPVEDTPASREPASDFAEPEGTEEESATEPEDQHIVGSEPEPDHAESDADGVPDESSEPGRLSEIVRQIEATNALFEPLGSDDDDLPDELAALAQPPESPAAPDEPAAPAPADESDEGMAEEAEQPHRLWRVLGTGPVRPRQDTVSAAQAEPADTTGGATTPQPPGEEADATGPQANLDQTARYNFDELSRQLVNRINAPQTDDQQQSGGAERQSASVTQGPGLELVLLNRLPIAVLLFQDEDVLFANRAFIDLIGCHSLAELRQMGLNRFIPEVEPGGGQAQPVMALVNIDAERIPVSARLQTVPFAGETVLMLTAQPIVAEDTPEQQQVNLLAAWAAARGEGLIEVDARGNVRACTDAAVSILGHAETRIIDRPFALFVRSEDANRLRQHLLREVRPGERTREDAFGYLPVRLQNGGMGHLFRDPASDELSFMVFLERAQQPETQPRNVDSSLLHRLSRSLRRPLNTIIGFSQLIESEAFGPIENPRYVQYAHDIAEAGRDITGQVDELDDYARIEGGKYPSETAEFDLGELLSDCEGMMRRHATVRQVFVRSAISETLPRIRADRASMRKAILNMLASAVDQTDKGGKVILSATTGDDGSIEVHVRDSGDATSELADRFAVFRETDGQRPDQMVPLRSSMGLALTRSLLSVNSCALSVGPASGTGNLLTLRIPGALIVAGKGEDSPS